jgi:hypothetical protein
MHMRVEAKIQRSIIRAMAALMPSSTAWLHASQQIGKQHFGGMDRKSEYHAIMKSRSCSKMRLRACRPSSNTTSSTAASIGIRIAKFSAMSRLASIPCHAARPRNCTTSMRLQAYLVGRHVRARHMQSHKSFFKKHAHTCKNKNTHLHH